MDCIDETNAPCYWRKPGHECGRGPDDGPCVHAQEIAARRMEAQYKRDAE